MGLSGPLILQVLLCWYCQFAATANSGTTCKAARAATMSGAQLGQLFLSPDCAGIRTRGKEAG